MANLKTVLVGLYIGLEAITASAQAPFGAQQIISNEVDIAMSVFAADLDGDGDWDVLSASLRDDKIAWYSNMDSQGNFGRQQIIGAPIVDANSIYAADLDGDGDQDVLAAWAGAYVDNAIAWYENTDSFASFGPAQIISTRSGRSHGGRTIYATDLDDDGDLDVLTASHVFGIAWYENIDGQGSFGSQIEITTLPLDFTSVYASDLDGDGDQDVLSSSHNSNSIEWYENLNDSTGFGPIQNITFEADYAVFVHASDLDGDGDQDVLSASQGDNKIAWYENMDGHASFGSQQVITTNAFASYAVHTADLDGDGDQDVLSASDAHLAWYENVDGLGNFNTNPPIADNASHVYAADLDGDGDQDVLAASFRDGHISWYENKLNAIDVSTKAESFPPLDGSRISPVYPNPFNSTMMLRLSLVQPQRVVVAVYNLLGEQVISEIELLAETEQVIRLEAGFLPAGVYVVRMTGEDFIATRRAVLAR